MTKIHAGIMLVIICTVIEGLSQVSLKKSTRAENTRIYWIILGMILFAGEAILYTNALEWLDISIACPLGTLCFVNVTLLSRWLLNEEITLNRWLGTGLIISGCALITA